MSILGLVDRVNDDVLSTAEGKRSMSSTVGQHGHTVELAAEALLREHPDAAEALLREHPDALVCGLSSDGLIVGIPKSVPLWGQAAIEGRAVFDSVVAADRKAVVDVWLRAKRAGARSEEGPVGKQGR